MSGDGGDVVSSVAWGPDDRVSRTLRDGTPIVLRAIRADDVAALRETYLRLSAESRYRRFFALGAREPDDAFFRYLCDVDGVDHVAIVACHETHDLKTEHVVGVARFVRLTDGPPPHDTAEAAITVVDDMQGRGLGRLLLEALVGAARARKIAHFRGEILSSNTPMRALLHTVGVDAGPDVPADRETEIPLEIDVPLDAHAAGTEGPMERILRAAAGALLGWRAALREGDELREDPAPEAR